MTTVGSVLLLAALVAAPAAAQTVTDPQIAAVVVTANQVDIDAGRLAQRMAEHPEVRRFAVQMVADHTSVNQAATALARKLKVTPEANDTSRALATGGATNLAALKALKGPAFDRAYIDHEVVYHQQVLDAIDKTLVPGAKNAELRALLVRTRPAIAAHLEHAKQIQATLTKGK